jgi:septum formation protein
MTNLILASSSRYKKELLSRLQCNFQCESPQIDESPLALEKPAVAAERLAIAKASKVAVIYTDSLVIGADQIADLNGTFINKPETHQQAAKQLRQQSGQTILFHSGLALVRTRRNGDIEYQSTVNSTQVTFRQLSDEIIERYLQLEKPYDCAGSFKAEGLGIGLFSEIKSTDPSSLIGLPLIDLCTFLRRFSYKIM